MIAASVFGVPPHPTEFPWCIGAYTTFTQGVALPFSTRNQLSHGLVHYVACMVWTRSPSTSSVTAPTRMLVNSVHHLWIQRHTTSTNNRTTYYFRCHKWPASSTWPIVCLLPSMISQRPSQNGLSSMIRLLHCPCHIPIYMFCE